ncbi:hypothetical protein SLA2020_151630 [Shorea laevis]
MEVLLDRVAYLSFHDSYYSACTAQSLNTKHAWVTKASVNPKTNVGLLHQYVNPHHQSLEETGIPNCSLNKQRTNYPLPSISTKETAFNGPFGTLHILE